MIIQNFLDEGAEWEFDDSRPSNDIPVTGKYLRSALDCLLTAKPIDPNQKPSMGCGIKWKK